MGCILVTLGLLPKKPSDVMHAFAEIGVIVIMFALAFDEDTTEFIASLKRSWGVALFGALTPFLVTYGVTQYFWNDSTVSLMSALAMTATSISLTLVTLRSEGLHRTRAATRIVTSAVIDDIAMLALIAVVVPLASGQTTASPLNITLIALKALGFFAVISIVARWIFPTNGSIFTFLPGLRRYSLQRLLTMHNGEHAVLVTLLIALLVALLSHEFGFHPAVGAHMAGLIMKKEFYALKMPNGKENPRVYIQARHVIDSIAFSWIGPIFFVLLGTNLILDLAILQSIVDEVIVISACLITAQAVSGALAARYTGNSDWPESWLIGVGLLGRAELAFVVLTIAYVQNRTISEEVFYTLMVTCFCMNIAVPFLIRAWKRRYGEASTRADTENRFATPPGYLNANWEETREQERSLGERRGDPEPPRS